MQDLIAQMCNLNLQSIRAPGCKSCLLLRAGRECGTLFPVSAYRAFSLGLIDSKGKKHYTYYKYL